MEPPEDKAVSDGSNSEVEEKNYLLDDENVLKEVRDRRVSGKLNDTVDNIFGSDSNSNEESTRFQNTWVTDAANFQQRNTAVYRRNKGLSDVTANSLPDEPNFFCLIFSLTVFGTMCCGQDYAMKLKDGESPLQPELQSGLHQQQKT